MKALITILVILPVAFLSTSALDAQAHRRGEQVRRKALRPVWEIIHRTDLSR
jgi:hypothetical protein